MSYDCKVFTLPENEMLSAFVLIVWFYKLGSWSCAQQRAQKVGKELEAEKPVHSGPHPSLAALSIDRACF